MAWLLFDNPRLGVPPTLSWSFSFAFAGVERDYGDSPVSVDIDWVYLPTDSWRTMAGLTAQTAQFAEPAEASVYFFQHHRYERVDLHILEQRGTEIHASAVLFGDIDGLGIETLTVTGWLTFAGIAVQLNAAASPEAALRHLQDFTDTAGLATAAHSSVQSFLIRPEGDSEGSWTT